MTGDWMLLLPVFAGLAMLYALLQSRRVPALAGCCPQALKAETDGDEDIKIAPGSFSQRRSGEDSAELAAQDFLRQKRSGNIDRARDLGRRFALALLDTDSGPLAGELEDKSMPVQHHQYLLYSYVVNHIIADHSPNSILAQTSTNIFYGEIEMNSPELYRHVSDMAAFSLYILCERSRSRSEDEIGRIFAGLCGAEGDRDLIRYGNRLYDKLYDYCVEEIRKTAYADA